MNRRGHRGRVDANQNAIAGILMRAGFTVFSLAPVGDGCPDLLVGGCGRTYLVEVKNGTKPLTKDQQAWHGDWRGDAVIVLRSEDDAVKFLTMAMRAGGKEPRPGALPGGEIAASQAGTPGRR